MKTNLLTHDFSTALTAHPEPPCLSLYQPTHRHHPGNQQDPLAFGLGGRDTASRLLDDWHKQTDKHDHKSA